MKDKVRENRIRRKLERMGYVLKKSRRRDPDALDYGGYMICDIQTTGVLSGADPIPFSMSLEDVEEWIEERGKV